MVRGPRQAAPRCRRVEMRLRTAGWPPAAERRVAWRVVVERRAARQVAAERPVVRRPGAQVSARRRAARRWAARQVAARRPAARPAFPSTRFRTSAVLAGSPASRSATARGTAATAPPESGTAIIPVPRPPRAAARSAFRASIPAAPPESPSAFPTGCAGALRRSGSVKRSTSGPGRPPFPASGTRPRQWNEESGPSVLGSATTRTPFSSRSA
jgi:hypothetical protein